MTGVWRATEADISLVAELWLEAAAWLRDRGSDQWQYPIKMHNIEAAVAAGDCWLVGERGAELGTVTLDASPDMSLWREEDEPHKALYLHRLVVRREARAQGLGSAVIDWASMRAAHLGKKWLRLDAWTSNTDLHQYYLALNFRHVRTVEGPGVVSGALFERPAGSTIGSGPGIESRDD